MAASRVVRIDDMEAIAFGTFKRARAELDVSAFGLQVLDLPPNLDAYPEHDHAEDGQEEVYFVLRGGGEIEIDGERIPLDPETAVSIKSGTRRKLWPGPDGRSVDHRARRLRLPGIGRARRALPDSRSLRHGPVAERARSHPRLCAGARRGRRRAAPPARRLRRVDVDRRSVCERARVGRRGDPA